MQLAFFLHETFFDWYNLYFEATNSSKNKVFESYFWKRVIRCSQMLWIKFSGILSFLCKPLRPSRWSQQIYQLVCVFKKKGLRLSFTAVFMLTQLSSDQLQYKFLWPSIVFQHLSVWVYTRQKDLCVCWVCVDKLINGNLPPLPGFPGTLPLWQWRDMTRPKTQMQKKIMSDIVYTTHSWSLSDMKTFVKLVPDDSVF